MSSPRDQGQLLFIEKHDRYFPFVTIGMGIVFLVLAFFLWKGMIGGTEIFHVRGWGPILAPVLGVFLLFGGIYKLIWGEKGHFLFFEHAVVRSAKGENSAIFYTEAARYRWKQNTYDTGIAVRLEIGAVDGTTWVIAISIPAKDTEGKLALAQQVRACIDKGCAENRLKKST